MATLTMPDTVNALLLGTHRSGRLLWLKPDGSLAWSFTGTDVLWPLADCNSAAFLAWACEKIWSGDIQRTGEQKG